MKKGQGLCPCNRMKLAHDDLGAWGWLWESPPRMERGDGTEASLESLVCALEHEDGVGDLEGGAQLDAHDLHYVGLSQQQEGLAVNHLLTHSRRYLIVTPRLEKFFFTRYYYYSFSNPDQ